jgi:hypothetical protein
VNDKLIKNIVIHEKLIQQFKKKALKTLPFEHAEAILGLQKDDTLYVYVLDEYKIIGVSKTVNNRTIKTTISYLQPEEEIEAGTGLKYFGSIHSHPFHPPIPSKIDEIEFMRTNVEEIYDLRAEQHEILTEKVMGIMSVKKRRKVNEHSLSFYNEQMESLQIIISTNKT